MADGLAAIEHYESILEQERAQVDQARLRYPDETSGAGSILAQVPARLPSDFVTPRISLWLLQNAYSRLTLNPDSEELSELINDVLLPMADLPVEEQTVEGVMHPRQIDVCSATEVNFGISLSHLGMDDSPEKTRTSRVYHDSSGRLLAWQKSIIIDSAILFAPVALGAVVPEGAFVGLGKSPHVEQSGEKHTKRHVYETYEIDGPFAINPSRIGPWAYDSVLDRALFAITTFDPDYRPVYMPDRGTGLVEKYSLQDFRNAARQVIEICKQDNAET